MNCNDVSFVLDDNGKLSAYYNADALAVISENCIIKTSANYVTLEPYMANHVECINDVSVYRYILKLSSDKYTYVVMEYNTNNIVNLYLVQNPFYFVADISELTPIFTFENSISLKDLSSKILNYGYMADVLNGLIDENIFNSLCQITGHVVK